ncbi:hypothetical protein D3C78_1118780 [compost metagenome]
MQRRRVNSPGQCHRHQAQGEAQRHQHQQLKPQGRVHDQDQLAQHQPQVRGDHIAAEHHATLLGIGLLVEPALDDHVLAHHPEADNHPQHDPGRQPVHQAMAQHCRPDNPGAGRIGADVADTSDQPVADLATQHQAEIVGGHQRTDPEAVHMVGGQAQGQVSTQEARADQHHQRGEIKRSKRFPDLAHRRSERLLEVSKGYLLKIARMRRFVMPGPRGHAAPRA